MNITRRNFIKNAAVIGATGLSALPVIANNGRTTEKSVIFIHLLGGASHIESFNPIPGATTEYKSVTGAIQTNVSDIRIGGTFVNTARIADKLSIFRSFAHTNPDHLGGTHWITTGKNSSGQTSEQTSPAIGSYVSRVKGPLNSKSLPNFVVNGYGFNYTFGSRAVWLGNQYSGFFTQGESIRDMNLRVDNARFNDRLNLLEGLGGLPNQFYNQAIGILNGEVAKFFDVESEPQHVKDLYGNSQLGNYFLLARKLAENGVGFITVNPPGNWDHHERISSGFSRESAILDRGFYGLITDIHQRGLQDKVMVVLTTEFGRTPRVNRSAGRDHWPQLSTLVVSGGGTRSGRIIGRSNERAEYPTERRVGPENMMGAIFHHLDISLDTHFNDNSGRPIRALDANDYIADLW